jgi:hypothetical protein
MAVSVRQSQSQSQNYVTTDGLPTISWSWRQSSCGSRSEIKILNGAFAVTVLCNTLSREKMGFSLICLTFRQVYISHM